MKTIIQILARIILGGAFLFSAYAKLYPIEPFELLLLQQGIASWEIAPFFSRILIASEALLGILIILGVYQKIVLRITAGVLVVFTIYILFILLKYGSEADCGCMGDMIKMNPYESVFKNIVLLGFTIYLLRYQKYSFEFYPLWVTICMALTAYSLPFMINPPDFYFAANNKDGNKDYPIDLKDIEDIVIDGKKPDFTKGEYILAFFSINCPHCRLASSRLELIKKELKELPPIYAVFAGKESKIPEFLSESKSSHLYYYMDDQQKFIRITRGAFPTIVYLKDGKVIKRFAPFELDPATFEKVLKKP